MTYFLMDNPQYHRRDGGARVAGAKRQDLP